MSDESTTGGPPGPPQWGQINRLATTARMVAGLAHELNNSLQVVSGLVELLGDRLDLPADAVGRIQKIGVQADKATGAIRQVLTYTREIGPETGNVNLGAVAEQALTLRRYHLGRAGIAASIAVPEEPLVLRGDQRALLQIFLNLLLNAEDALAQQPVRQLHVEVTGSQGWAEIVVSDTGHGVDEAIRSEIFQPFFTTRATERAVGLGLPVARLLAQRHGGAVSLMNGAPGQTRFLVSLPI